MAVGLGVSVGAGVGVSVAVASWIGVSVAFGAAVGVGVSVAIGGFGVQAGITKETERRKVIRIDLDLGIFMSELHFFELNSV